MGTCPVLRVALSLPGERAPRLCGEGRERSPRGSWVSAYGTRTSLGVTETSLRQQGCISGWRQGPGCKDKVAPGSTAGKPF